VAVFEIYKPTQGRYVRLGTAIVLGLMLALGLVWLSGYLENLPLYVRGGIILVVGLAGAYGVFYACNRPNLVDFFDKTESEMRKVTWPTREAVIRSTQIVISITLFLAFLLWAVDIGFLQLFRAMGLFSSGIGK
jgi:preprotein translocase SecE subunit